ncbi:hypothetical protein JRI60_23470 [Archangium violaceum]|uniref:hypothetical protein n=1 Tax=Archangium violaceum TaxID=83451 RepID=UPI00194FBF2D|nr:hypothetical protein [Archangium violaceum]QRO01771.1 hypothetical protein JRI60_23470 [Archangium violaceum]
MANDQDSQLPSTSDENAVAAQAPAPRKLEQPATWPGNVPSQAQALEVLRGRLSLAVSLPGARKLLEKLTQPEREALLVDGQADALREALVARWRLAAARDLLLTAGGKVDAEALNALLAEVDHSLETLRAANPATPELGLAIDRTWETLTQEAVDFSSDVKAASNQPAAPAPAPVAHHRPAATGKMSFDTENPEQAGRRKKVQLLQIAALVVVALAVGAYHLSSTPSSKPSNHAGAPNNTLITTDAKTGTQVVRSTLVGPASPELRAWLDQQKAKGLEVKELDPGTWLIGPAQKAPVTAGNGSP